MKPSPVLITESADEFSRLRDDIKDEFKPHGAVEHFKVEEIAALIWEIHRYRRAKTTMINSAFREALQRLLKRVCRQPAQSVFDIEEDTEDDIEEDAEDDIEVDAEELAHQWFGNDPSAKQLILQKLAYFGLDEHAIEAEAMRIMAPDLERLDRVLTSLEWRLDKALRSFAEFRGVLAPYLRETAERVIDGKVLPLSSASKNPPPRAA
jgi:hypothetical protein